MMDESMKLCTDVAGRVIGKGLSPEERAAKIQNIAGFPDLTRERVCPDIPSAEEILIEQFRLAMNDGLDAVTELARLRKQLPVSRDGVTQVPLKGGLWEVRFVPKLYVVRCVFWKGFEGVWHVCNNLAEGRWIPVSCCYSTSAAALAAGETALAAETERLSR